MATRIGCCINMLSRKQDETAMNYINELAQMGYDYLEIPLTQVMELSSAEFDKMREALSKKDIQCEVCNDFIPDSIKITGPDVKWGIINGYLDRALTRAYKLGVKIIVFGSGRARYVEEGFPKDKAFWQLVTFLQRVSAKAAPYGISIAIEPLNREECNIINSIDEAFKLSDAVNAENVRVLADFYHMVKENDNLESMSSERRCPLIHAHISDPRNGRLFPTEMETHRDFLKKVKERRIGTISVEGYTTDFESDARKSLKMLKSALS